MFHYLLPLSLLCSIILFPFSKVFGNEESTKFTNTNHTSLSSVNDIESKSLFERIPNTSGKSYHHILQDYELLRLNKEVLLDIMNDKSKNIQLRIPVSGGELIELELREVDITSKGYRLMTPKGERPSTANKHFRGYIKGEGNSLAAISLSNNAVHGIFSNHSGNFNLGQLEDDSGNYIVYNSNLMKVANPFKCHTSEEQFAGDNIPHTTLEKTVTDGVCRFVKLYWEADYEIFEHFGTIANTEFFIQAIFNQMAILYGNEGIVVELSELKIWTISDNYGDTDSEVALNSFRNRWNTQGNNFNGDLAHLVAFDEGNNGGRARINALCLKPIAHAYSDISASYDDVPTYSWTVNVLAHETGHNLGSQHTHACAWNGNNTKIDNCGGQYHSDYNDNNCVGSPPSPANGGTVMSYCHLIPSVLINLNEGFHPQIAEFMGNRINNSQCLEILPICENDVNLTRESHNISFSDTELTMNISVINEGFITADYSKVGYYASKDDTISTDDILLGLDEVPILSWGAIASRNLVVDLCDIEEIQSDSAYHFGYIIDQDYAIEETDENDNIFKLTNYPKTIVCLQEDTTTVSIQNLEDWISYDLFPNPAFDDITITANWEKKESTTISIYNVLGQQVYQKNLGNTNEISENITLKHFPNGTYFMTLSTGGNHLSRKFVVAR